MHSFLHSLIPSFPPSFLSSFVRSSSIHSFFLSFIHSFMHSFVQPFVHSFVQPFIHSLMKVCATAQELLYPPLKNSRTERSRPAGGGSQILPEQSHPETPPLKCKATLATQHIRKAGLYRDHIQTIWARMSQFWTYWNPRSLAGSIPARAGESREALHRKGRRHNQNKHAACFGSFQFNNTSSASWVMGIFNNDSRLARHDHRDGRFEL